MEFDFHENYSESGNVPYENDENNNKNPTVQDFRDYYYNKFINENNQEPETQCEKRSYKTKIIDTFVNIDSRNRDKSKYPNNNNYIISLDREYTNVKEIRVVSTQFANINKNVFHDPILLKNDTLYWQRFSENNLKIFDYEFVSNNQISICLNDIDIELLDYLFEGIDDIQEFNENNINQNVSYLNEIDDENICRYIIKKNLYTYILKSKNQGDIVFDISFNEFINAQDNDNIKIFEKYYYHYYQKYINNKKIKITYNEFINGVYECKSFFIRFYYFGNNWKDCFVLLGINCVCLLDDDFSEIIFQNSSKYHKIDAMNICVEYYGNCQIIEYNLNDYDDTFKTFSTQVDSGLYEDKTISKEMSSRMNEVDPDVYEFDVNIDEHKNLSQIKCFKKRLLGNDCLFFRPYIPILDRISPEKKKRKFILIIRNIMHKFVENDSILLRFDRNRKFHSSGLNLFSQIKDTIYDKEFRVHMCKFDMIENIDKNEIIFKDICGEIHDIAINKSELHYPICHHFFYIDLSEHFSRDVCENLFIGKESFGIGYNFKNMLYSAHDIKLSIKNPISCFGDMLINYEKIKLINSKIDSIQSFLGFDLSDTSDFIVKRTYRQARFDNIFYCENHKLQTGDIIYINNTKIIIKYVSDDYFSIENQLLKDSEKYFYNTNPIYFYGNSILNYKINEHEDDLEIDYQEIVVENNNILFKFKSKYNFFFMNQDIFECLFYPNIPILLKKYKNDDLFYFVSATDGKPLKNFWNYKGKYIFSRKKVVKITYYNHQLSTGINSVQISGFVPLNGEYVIYKSNKDQFCIMSKYMSDDGIYKKYKNQYIPFNIKITSNYFGFKNEINNVDLFGNSTSDINFESFPYIFCTSSVLGGNIQNIYNNGNNNRIFPLQELNNIFMKINMPEKLIRESRMIYDRHIQTSKTFPSTPLPSLSFIDLQFWYPNGIPYDFQKTEHSFVLLIREYFDYNNDINYSTKRGNTDDINTFPQIVYQNN